MLIADIDKPDIMQPASAAMKRYPVIALCCKQTRVS